MPHNAKSHSHECLEYAWSLVKEYGPLAGVHARDIAERLMRAHDPAGSGSWIEIARMADMLLTDEGAGVLH